MIMNTLLNKGYIFNRIILKLFNNYIQSQQSQHFFTTKTQRH